MSQSQLKQLLSEMADDTVSVPMYDRALRRYRRLNAGRTVLAGVAVLALAGSTALGVSALPGNTEQAAAGDLENSRLVFTLEKENSTGPGSTENLYQADIATWEPATSEPRVIPLEHRYYAGTDKVSPDGGQFSYVGDDNAVHVIDLDTGEEIDLPADAPGLTDVPLSEYDFPTATPAWSPDSQRLWIDTGEGGDDRYGFVNLGTGEFEPTYTPRDWWSVQVTAAEDGTERLLGVRRDGDKTELVDIAATEDDEVRVMSDEDSMIDGEYPTRIHDATIDGQRLCVETDPEAAPGGPSCLYMAVYDEETQHYRILEHDGPYVFGERKDQCVEQWTETGGGSLLQPGHESSLLRLTQCGDDNVIGVLELDENLTERRAGLVSYHP